MIDLVLYILAGVLIGGGIWGLLFHVWNGYEKQTKVEKKYLDEKKLQRLEYKGDKALWEALKEDDPATLVYLGMDPNFPPKKKGIVKEEEEHKVKHGNYHWNGSRFDKNKTRCYSCGQLFEKKEAYAPAPFRNTWYCSEKCMKATLSSNSKTCYFCGKIFHWKKAFGKYESKWYCSKKCYYTNTIVPPATQTPNSPVKEGLSL